MFLKNGDINVLYYDFDAGVIEVLNKDFLPYSLKDFLQSTSYNNREESIKSGKHITALRDFLSNRLLSLTRENAKAILNSLGLPQTLKTDERIKVVEACQGLSMIDNFWLAEESDTRLFEDANLRTHSLSEVAYQISLLGKTISATYSDLIPDMTTGGMFAKAWHREGNKVLLWKTNKSHVNVNVKAELKASDYLNKLGIEHVPYYLSEVNRRPISVCENIATNAFSVIDGYDLQDWCQHTGTTLLDFVCKYYLEDMANMIIFDYCVANTDRHLGNIHFFVDNGTNLLAGPTPLLDHNQAFIADLVGSDIDDLTYDLTNKPFKQSAKEFYKYSTFNNKDTSFMSNACKRRLFKIAN